MLLEIDHLGYEYNEGQPVLQDVTFTIDKPGLYCIIGPNGVGKSTLVRCINKLLKATTGSVRLDGMDVSTMKFKELAKHIGYVPVSDGGYFPMTVMETVMLGRHPHNSLVSSTKEDFDLVYDILESMNIAHLAMRDFGELSAGQHQRVTIARGLAQQPEILLLDEPTANLDVRFQIMVTRLLRDTAHRDGIIIVMISHDLNIASRFADNVLLMTPPGILYRTGPSDDVITRENIRYAYGVDCRITEVDGRPHVILLDELSEEEMIDLRGTGFDS